MDLTPHKTCTQDCVFCQLGRTTNRTIIRREYVPVREVLGELGEWLERKGNADHITLSGCGEPTLHSGIGEVLRFVRENSPIKSVLLTNGSLLHLPEVRRAASQAHIVKISLSAWDQASYGWVNRPHPELEFNRLIEGQKAFRAEFTGQLWLEVFAVAGMNSTPSDMSRIAALAEQLGADRIHLNTSTRPPAEDFVAPLSRERLASLCPVFRPEAEVISEFKTQDGGEIQSSQEEILSMLQRRPCTTQDIAGAFGMHLHEAFKTVEGLMREGRIRAERSSGFIYYRSAVKQSLTDTLGTGDRIQD
ncbi:MAG: radical SAM protein [Thermodesulfobacteriota bacterium]